MDELLKEFEDNGIKVVVGYREKERKKRILYAYRKLKESGDDVKFNYVKTLYRYYCMFNNLGHIIIPRKIPLEEDKYRLHYLCSYLEGVVNTSKLIIADVITALGNDESIKPFSKYLMFTHMYAPEDVKEIGHEEIYRRKQKFKEDELPPDVSYHQDDGTNGKDYEISGFGWNEDGRGYITVSEKSGNENDIFEEVNIPVPLILREDWFRKIREYNLNN